MNKPKIFLAGLKDGFRNFSHSVTDAVNFILLFFVYFIGVGMVSVASKVLGKHYLDLKKNGSSWVQRKLGKRPIEEYYRLF